MSSSHEILNALLPSLQKCEAHIYGDFIRDVLILKQKQYSHIDIWFANHLQIDEFIQEVRKHFETTDYKMCIKERNEKNIILFIENLEKQLYLNLTAASVLVLDSYVNLLCWNCQADRFENIIGLDQVLDIVNVLELPNDNQYNGKEIVNFILNKEFVLLPAFKAALKIEQIESQNSILKLRAANANIDIEHLLKLTRPKQQYLNNIAKQGWTII